MWIINGLRTLYVYINIFFRLPSFFEIFSQPSKYHSRLQLARLIIVYYGHKNINLFHAFTTRLFTTDFNPLSYKGIFSLEILLFSLCA